MNDLNRKLKLVEEITTVRRAVEITGGLSQPSKMPGAAWGISASLCKRGSVLAKMPGTVCSICYCNNKGNYRYPSVQKAHANRIAGFEHPAWVAAMTFLIGREAEPYFRFFDSGDLQSVEMLEKIFAVCRALPKVKFWMPTRECGILRACSRAVPRNLVIRVSAAFINGKPPAGFTHVSTVVSNDHRKHWAALVQHNNRSKHFCPALLQESSCGNCRKCFGRSTRQVVYCAHG